MAELSALWLPILLSAVFVFVVSAIIHMGPFWHRNDFPQLPDEAAARAALGPLRIPPGEYMLPRCNSAAEMKGAEFAQKMQEGPVMILTVRPNGMVNMAKPLGLWFVYLLVIGVFAAYVAALALPADAHYLSVFRLAGTAAFMGLGLGLAHDPIWYGRKWSTTFKLMLDALIYALIIGGTFGWLWPTLA